MAQKNNLKIVIRDIENVKKILYDNDLILEAKGESIEAISKNGYTITWNGKNSSSTIIYDNNIGIDYIMKQLLENHQYSILLYDRSLIQFEFSIEDDIIIKQRMLFIKKHNKIWDKDEIVSISSLQDADFFDYFFGNDGIPTMIRIDYDKNNFLDCDHPISHMTISNYKTCRIPIKSLMSCTKFILMILDHFYDLKIEKKYTDFEYIDDTITENEKNMIHLSWK